MYNEHIMHSMSKYPSNLTLVTALYDIHRVDRSFVQYLTWFERTLEFPFPMVIYCNEMQVVDLAMHIRSKFAVNMTHIIIEENYPLHSLGATVNPMLALAKQQQSSMAWRAEWDNADYILLTFSKFVWMQKAMLDNYLPVTSHYAWVDAGISRFRTWEQFLGLKPLLFPELIVSHLSEQQVGIQTVFAQTDFAQTGGLPALSKFTEAVHNQENLIKAGIFGGSQEAMQWLSQNMLHILYKDFIQNDMIGNEQVGMALLYSRFPQHFKIFTPEDFNASNYYWDCNFICL